MTHIEVIICVKRFVRKFQIFFILACVYSCQHVSKAAVPKTTHSLQIKTDNMLPTYFGNIFVFSQFYASVFVCTEIIMHPQKEMSKL